MSSLGFNITHPSGTEVQPSKTGEDRRNVEGPDTSKQTQRRKITGEAKEYQIIIRKGISALPKTKSGATLGRPLRIENYLIVTTLALLKTRKTVTQGTTERPLLGTRADHDKLIRVDLVNSKDISPNMLKVITPNESVLAKEMCDFAEELWGCEPLPNIAVSDWGSNAVKLEKEQGLGILKKWTW